MRKIIKWILIVSGILLLTTLIAGTISITLTDLAGIEEVEESKASAARSCPKVMIIQQLLLGGGLTKPVAQDGTSPIYCREPGIPLPTTYNGRLYTKQQIDAWDGEDSSETCGCASDCTHLGYHSTTYYACKNEHYKESDSYYNPYKGEYHENLYDVGFILSFKKDPLLHETQDSWDAVIQQAVWRSPVCKKDAPNRGLEHNRGVALHNSSLYYKEFYEKILQTYSEYYTSANRKGDYQYYQKAIQLYENGTKDKNVSPWYDKDIIQEKIPDGTGPKPVDLTDQNKIKWDTNQETKTHIIGPFRMDYLMSTNASGYTGISDMYLIDNNGKRIDIKAFIRTGKTEGITVNTPVDKLHSNYGEPRFWTIKDHAYQRDNPNCTDYYYAFHYYPDPGEEFYVEVAYADTATSSSFTLRTEFQWTICEAEVCLRDGWYWKLFQDENDSYNPHPHSCGEDCSYTAYGCWKELYVSQLPAQDGVYVVSSKRYLGWDYLDIPIENGAGSKNMKIGGFVYEDYAQTKENVTNGIKDAGDIALANVEVSLYDAQTNQLVKLAPAKDEIVKRVGETDQQFAQRVAEITNDKDDYLRRINPTLTDEKGYYEFRGVSVEKKYYVKFTYNGQTYMATDYLAKVNDSTGNDEYKYNSVQQMVKAGEYDGPTNEGVRLNKEKWQQTSKGTEKESEREDFDNRFGSIGSSPNNYVSTNSLRINRYLERENGDYYNETFSWYELAGFTLEPDGTYSYDEDKQLVDTYLKLVRGYIIDTRDAEYKQSGDTEFKEGVITKAIKKYIDQYRKYPANMKEDIYQSIASNDTTLWRKLQFIEDCKIDSYTKSAKVENERSFDVYPVYNQFTTYVAEGNKYPDNSYYNPTKRYDRGSYSENGMVYENHYLKHHGNGTYGELIFEATGNAQTGAGLKYQHTNLNNDLGEILFKNIYNGQLQINQGLVRRQEYDVSLRKDVYKATVQVNGKTEIYDYDKRDMTTDEEKAELKRLQNRYGKDSEEYLSYQQELEDRYWDIQTRIIGNNYDTYYNSYYDRELYSSDYHAYQIGNVLDVYITYKITVRNQSQSILAQIDEIVDYYDSSYTFEPDLSWAMYRENLDSYDEVRITSQDFYDIMAKRDKDATGDDKFRDVTIGRRYDTETGQYADNTQFDLGRNYDTLYVNGLSDHKLVTGESGYIYLTFKVNGTGNNLATDSRTEEGKQNIAEINGYTTYYADGTRLPNKVRKNSNDIAGLIDRDSNPGNFDEDALNNTDGTKRYEQNFEDDADRGKGIRVYVEDDLIRKVSGTTWEDKRNYQSTTADGNKLTDALVGNGVKENGEVRISGLGVELHEVVNGVTQEQVAKIWNGSQWVDAKQTTDAQGNYHFEGYRPGEYVVRFIYGGEYNAKYNGQDYKSTSYQYNHINNTAIDQSGNTDVNGNTQDYRRYNGFANYEVQNDTATYGYFIHRSDEFGIDVSDAKDIYSSTQIARNRENVNNYSSNQYQGVTNGLSTTLNANTIPNVNTQMIAETGVIVAEFEYNRQTSDGDNAGDNNGYNDLNYKDNINNKYHLENVDFGLEERPKAGLELNKQIENVKITLANQNILFDAKSTVNNLAWKPKTPYDVNSLKDATKYDNNGNRNGGQNAYSDYTKYDEFRNDVREKITKLITEQKGLIQATMDEELMHGSTIEITYDVTMVNIGEVDYHEKTFYYTGKVQNESTIVHTAADVVIDYVANNLQFRKDSNKSEWQWKTITEQNIKNNNYVNNDVSKVLKEFNTIITTTGLSKPLIPLTQSTESSNDTHTEIQLVLTQLITAQNTDDDLTYDNIAEIVKISNEVGRRMAYSVQGNQDPLDLDNINEPDTSKAERVIILPPFGVGEIVVYVAVTLGVLAILSTGIILIKRKVLKKE